MGALHFRLDKNGPFLNDNKAIAAPPWTSLRDMEYASLKFEEDNTDDPEYLKWVAMLFPPGLY
jgi:serine/threonine-protein kinase HipA